MSTFLASVSTTTEDHWCTTTYTPLCRAGSNTFRREKPSFTPTIQKTQNQRSVTTRCSLELRQSFDASKLLMALHPWRNLPDLVFVAHLMYLRKARFRVGSAGHDRRKRRHATRRLKQQEKDKKKCKSNLYQIWSNEEKLCNDKIQVAKKAW